MTRTLVVVPCGKEKVWDRFRGLAKPVPARWVYTGTPFRLYRRYAQRFGDSWVVLSAKYGLILPDFPIPGPYDVTFNDPATGPIGWTELRRQVHELGLGNFVRVVVLGGKRYCDAMRAAFGKTSVLLEFPLCGLSIGRGMGAIKKALEKGLPCK